MVFQGVYVLVVIMLAGLEVALPFGYIGSLVQGDDSLKNLKQVRFLLISLLLLFAMILAACGDEPASDQAPEEQAPLSDSAEVPAAEATASDQAGAPAPAGAVDTGFRPQEHGFSYQNYGDTGQTPSGETFSVVNLTSIEMRRMFGEAVCAGPAESDGSCALTPPASQWMDQNNASMNGGHCEGFAVLSQLIFDGKLDANSFGAARTFDLQIQNNEALQRELAYWWATQGPLSGKGTQRLAPKDAIDYLKTEYSNNPKNLISIGIYKEDMTGGHAITAYGVQDQGNGIFWIMVYDNNYPGDERHMTVDTNANTWEYEASINPSVEPDLYKGSPENPIEFTPDQERLAVFPCDFCNQSGTASKGSGLAQLAPQFNEIWTEGYINVELEDDKGRKIGYDDKGALVNEITEAKIQPVKAGILSEVPPVIDMPVGLGFTAYIYGDSNAAAEPASVVMIGRGFYIGIDGLSMAPGQLDQLAFDGEGDFLTYTTDAAESPDIIVGIEKPQADFELDLKALEVSKGTDIHVLFDQKEDTFSFQTSSDAVATFSVSITRIGADGQEETFDTGDSPLEVGPDKMMYFYFGKWQGQGSNLEVGYDENGDGTIADSEITNMADAK